MGEGADGCRQRRCTASASALPDNVLGVAPQLFETDFRIVNMPRGGSSNFEMQRNRSLRTLKGNKFLLLEPSLNLDDPYLLAPLDLQQVNIRLVELLPSSDPDNIRCHMRSYALNDTCPPYVALSYKWDHETPKDTIELNGTGVSVGHSLWAFLNRMRLRGNFVTFWIDAICINQSDTMERNHQVQMMKSIYSRAQSVTIWLGESEQDSDLDNAMSRLRRWITFKYGSRKCSPSRSFDSRYYDVKLHSLCNHEYWRRMWIIQEVFHARHATIYCGSRDVNMYALEQLVAHVHALHDHDKLARGVGSFLRTPAAELVELKRNGKPASPFEFIDNIPQSRDNRSSRQSVCSTWNV